eukprot:scaffold3598_cov115-Cylindrotheca_fusiformis.AAC.11
MDRFFQEMSKHTIQSCRTVWDGKKPSMASIPAIYFRIRFGQKQAHQWQDAIRKRDSRMLDVTPTSKTERKLVMSRVKMCDPRKMWFTEPQDSKHHSRPTIDANTWKRTDLLHCHHMSSKFWQGSDSSSSDCEEDEVQEPSHDIRSRSSIEGTRLTREELSSDPDLAWKHIQDNQVFQPIPYTTTRAENSVRIVCISDTHGKHREVCLPPGDILIHGGDFTKCGEIGSIRDLGAYFQESGFAEVVCIAGNHDLPLHPGFYKEQWKRFHATPVDMNKAQHALTGCTYLNDSSYTTKHGLEVYGSPWSPFFFDWAFNLYRGRDIREKWELIPDSSDILITHGPPLGRGDFTSSHIRAGCYDLLVEVQQRVKPRVHIFGHIHEGAGVSYDGSTIYINASNLNLAYRVENYPTVVDVPLDTAKMASIVRPNCTMDPAEFLEWCREQEYHLLVGHMEQNDISTLPSGNEFLDADAYTVIFDSLALHRDGEAGQELKTALANLYAHSFSN